MSDNKDEKYFDDETYYSEEDFFNSDDENQSEPERKTKWIKVTISLILVLSLFSYVLAIYPQLFNRATIDFISTSIELSKTEEVKLYKKSVVIVKADNSKGTGFYYSDNGYIITNYHVIEGQQTAKVTFNDGKTYSANVVNSDKEVDIAVLKIEANDLTYPILELEDRWSQDETVYIIGNPLSSSFIVNKGNIIGQMSNGVIPVLVIDASVYRGNSGSPVINSEGKVVGVIYATAYINHQGIEKKVGLAIPIEYSRIH